MDANEPIDTTSHPPEGSRNVSNAVDTSVELTSAVVAIVKEVGEMLHSVPYVKSLSGVILQIIKVRDEIKANKKRCREITDKILRMSKSIYEKLAEVARSNQREKLSRLEGHLNAHERALTAVYIALDRHRARSRFSRLVNRGLDELNEHDRRLDELNTQLILDIIFHITMEQVSTTQASTASYKTEESSEGLSTNDLDHVLPPTPYFLVERDAQVDMALKVLLSAETSRIAILGGGGFGKTTLARKIIHDPKVIERYHSRYFLSCEGMPDIDTLLLGLGAMLGIKAAPSAILATARHVLEKSTTLLCLDNFETPWEPFETRTKIEEALESIASISNLSLIITLRGEQRPSKIAWSKPLLPPLSTLTLNGAISITENIAGDEAIDDFTLQLLQAIDGIPLAITLVGTLLRDGESSESLWKRWSANSTQIIHTGGDDRQSNLNRSIALSVYSSRMSRNSDTSRQLLAALSLLPYGFPSDEDIVEYLQENLNIVDVRTVLQTLRMVALVRVDETTGFTRLQMLSPIRLFCHQFLTREILLAHAKIVDYYIHTLLEAEHDFDNNEYYARISPEVKNIHSVFLKAFTTSDFLPELEKLVQATIYLADWSWYTGYYAKETIQMAIARTTHIPKLYADSLIAMGNLFKWEADYENAEKIFREAASLQRQENDLRGEAKALKHLGDILLEMRQIDEAESTILASLKLYAKINDKWGLPSVRFSLGTLYLQSDKYLEAEENLTSALEAYRRCADLIGQANVTQSIAWLHIQLGNSIEAEKYANESLVLSTKANYAVGIGNALGYLGDIYIFTDRIADAIVILEKANAVYTRQNNLINQLITAEQLAFAYIQSDRMSKAEALLVESIKIELDVVQIVAVMCTLGLLYIRAANFAKAEHHLHNCLQRLDKFEDKFEKARALMYLGTLYSLSNRTDDAETLLKSIPDLLTRQEFEMHRLWVLGDIYIHKGDLDDAEASLNSALVWAKQAQLSYQQGNIIRSMGTLRMKRGSIDHAIEKFKEALDFHRKAQWVSEQAKDFKRLGEAYEILGSNPEEAEAAFKESDALMESVREFQVLSTS